MSARLPLCMAQALAPFAPPQSSVHAIVGKPALLDVLAEVKASLPDHLRSEPEQDDAPVPAPAVALPRRRITVRESAEAELLEADRARNVNKAERAIEREAEYALDLQIKHQNLPGAWA